MAEAGACTLADVLGLVAEHSPELSDSRTLCSLLCVSHACRQQLQQARGHWRWDVSWGTFPRACQQVAAVAQWLPRHQGLLSAVEVFCFGQRDLEGFPPHERQLVLGECRLALQRCQSWRAAAAAAAGVAATSLPPPLQLRSLRTRLVPEPELLEALAGLGLQELHVMADAQCLSARWCAALARLTSLRELHMQPPQSGCVHARSSELVAAVQQLTQLTYLSCIDPWVWPAAAVQLPPSLRYLSAYFIGDKGSVVDLRHLTALEELDWEASYHMEVAVGPQLTELHTYTPMRLVGGARLECVDVDACACYPLLAHLSSLAGLSRLTLQAESPWRVTPREMQQAAAAIGSASSLTYLQLHLDLDAWAWASSGFDEDEDGEQQQQQQQQRSIDWGRELARLSRLRELHITCADHLPSGSLLQLTALTSLHELELKACPGAVDDVVAVALARSLTGLTSLELSCDTISSVAGLLPALGALTGLCGLCIEGGPRFVVGDADLVLLSRLTQLGVLSLRRGEFTDEGAEKFVRGMPWLAYIES